MTGVRRSDPVLPTALNVPLFNKLRGKHVVLASGSPRRLEILRTYGLDPVVCPSTFPETLSHADYEDPAQYAVATGSAKAVEVYEKLVQENPNDPPDLVIGSDTVVILGGTNPAILEKPSSKGDQLDMLESYRGADVRVATGVTLVQPQLATPGYKCTSLVVTSKVVFAENSPDLLNAYVECGEGIDRAGGFAIQGMGGLLVERIEGDYNNIVGFPGQVRQTSCLHSMICLVLKHRCLQAFFKWLGEMAEEGTLLEED